MIAVIKQRSWFSQEGEVKNTALLPRCQQHTWHITEEGCIFIFNTSLHYYAPLGSLPILVCSEWYSLISFLLLPYSLG